MLDADVNMLAVLVAAVSAMVIGSAWYGALFNKPWMALAYPGQDPAQLRETGNPGLGYAIAAVGSLVTAFVLANFISLSEATTAIDGAFVGLVVWAGFQATMLAINYTFNGRPLGLYWIDVANQLVTMLVMGAILGAWQ